MQSAETERTAPHTIVISSDDDSSDSELDVDVSDSNVMDFSGEFIDEYDSEESDEDEDLDEIINMNDSQTFCSLLADGMKTYLKEMKERARRSLSAVHSAG